MAERLVYGNLAILSDGLEHYQQAVDAAVSVKDLVKLKALIKKKNFFFLDLRDGGILKILQAAWFLKGQTRENPALKFAVSPGNCSKFTLA